MSPPAAGKSLFDTLFAAAGSSPETHAIPFPFAALVEQLRLGGAETRAVLIPLGRSLQRRAAAPDYFESPRVVVAVVGDAAGEGLQPPLKDRLFLGYQARSAAIEVISYNEDAGRFEFQVVRNYTQNGKPEVRNVRRGVCTRCHQNHGPIFSKALWDETNANSEVAARLAAVASQFHGVPAALDIDQPDAFDAATDRANLLAVYQRVWQDGCSAAPATNAPECRADLLVTALRYLAAGRRPARAAEERRQALEALQQSWPHLWPGGLAIPDPDLPNRRLELFADVRGPLDVPGALRNGKPVEGAALARAAQIAPQLEPSNERAPLSVWHHAALDEQRMDEIVAGVASFFSAADVEELLRHADRHPAAATTPLRAECALARAPSAQMPNTTFTLACGAERHGELQVEMSFTAPASSGAGSTTAVLRTLRLPHGDAVPSQRLRVERDGEALRFTPLGATPLRTLAGNSVRRIELRTGGAGDPAGEASIGVELREDFAAVAAAADTVVMRTEAGVTDALGAAPLRRAAVLRELLAALSFGERGAAP